MPGRYEGRRILLSSAAALCSVAAIGLAALTRGLAGAFVGSMLLLVALGIYVYYWFLSKSVYTASHPSSHTHGVVDDVNDILQELETSVRQYTVDELTEAVELLSNPRSAIDRITERATPYSRSVALSTSIAIRLGASLKHRLVVVPVLLVERGQLQDGLRLTGPNGERVSSLTRIESASYVASLIRALVASVGASQLTSYKDGIELRVIGLLCANGPTSPEEVQAITDEIYMLGGPPPLIVSLLHVCQMVRTLAVRYPVMIEYVVPPTPNDQEIQGLRLRFSADRRAITILSRKAARLSKLRDDSRKLLGIRPALISVPLFNATRCGSYHLQVTGPEGTYLADQRIVELNGTEAALSQARYAMRPRMGQRHSHLYIRSTDDSFDQRQYQNYFYERVPGSVGFAAMSALSAAVIVTLIAVLRLGLLMGGGSDLVLALLALPAIAGTWLGLEERSGLAGGTLAARASNIATVSVSLVTAGVFVLLSAPGRVLQGPIGERPNGTLWILLFGVSVLNFVAIAGSWLLRAVVQRDLMSRTDVGGQIDNST